MANYATYTYFDSQTKLNETAMYEYGLKNKAFAQKAKITNFDK